MARKSRYLTAILPDGYVKTIGPTAIAFTHYWRIVAILANGKTEVFWGHAKSLAEVKKKRTAVTEAGRIRGWQRHHFDIVELVERGWPGQPLPPTINGDDNGGDGAGDGDGGRTGARRRR